jgi:hypothetical protein
MFGGVGRMSECKGCSFEVGDKVKVEFEGVVMQMTDKKSYQKIYDKAQDHHFYIENEHLTLIEPAKPELEVGQCWECKKGTTRNLYEIFEGKWFYRRQEIGAHFWGGDSCSVEYFKRHYAHKLISE